MTLRFTPRAIAELESIADYLKERSPASAVRVRDAFLSSLLTLVEFPKAGRPQTVDGVRKFVASRYAFLVYYVVNDETGDIEILTIQHPARDREFVDF